MIRKVFILVLFLSIFPISPEEKPASKLKPWKTRKRIALLVGINKYKSTTDLKYAVSDSQRMANLLSKIGYKKENIYVLNDEEGKDDESKLPTKANVEKWVKKLSAAQDLDTFLFYFSGHGFMSKDQNTLAFSDTKITFSKDGETKHENTLEISEITQMISSSQVNKLILIDAYRSPLPKRAAKPKKKKDSGKKKSVSPIGKSTKETAKTNQTKPKVNEFILSSHDEDVPSSLLEFSPGVYALIGTAPNKYSIEDNFYKGGVFTHFLLKGLAGGVLDSVPEEYVTYGALKEYIEDRFKDHNSDKKEVTQVLYQNIAGVGTGNQTDKFVISLGRADGKKVFRLRYKNAANKPTLAKLVLTKDGIQDSIQFYKQSDPNTPPVPDDLHGVWKMKYFFSHKMFYTEEYNLEKLKTNTYVLEYSDRRGWNYESFYRPDINFGEQEKKKIRLSEKEKKKIKFQKLLFDFNGNNTSAEYFEEDINKRVLIGGKIAKVKNAYDYNSEITLEEYRDAKGNLVENDEGIARYVASYRDKNAPVLEETYNAKGDLKDNKIGYARISYKYNENEKLTEKYYLDSKFKKADNEEGIHSYEYHYNPKLVEKLEKVIHKDKDGKPHSDEEDIAKKLYQYDEKGNLLSEEYYRSDERPWHLNGKSKATYTYDKDGRIKTVSYFSEHLDKDGKHLPSTDNFGVHKYELSYNQVCLSKKKELSKKLDDPISPKVKRFWFDPKNAAKDCVLNYKIFDAKDKPITDRNGCHKMEIRYDNLKESFRLCKDTAGKFSWMNRKDEFTYYQYDEKGKGILEETFANGKPKGYDYYGIARKEWKYDEKGNKILEAYYGKSGKPESNWYGIARYEYKYDKKGNKVVEKLYDKNLKYQDLALYDEFIYDSFFGKDGIYEYRDLSLDNDFFLEARFDKDNIFEYKESLYEEDGKLKAKIEWKYDVKGNEILEATYGEDGKLRQKNEYKYDINCWNKVANEFGDNSKLFEKKKNEFDTKTKSCKLFKAEFNEKNEVQEFFLYKNGKTIFQAVLDEEGYVKKDEGLNFLYFQNERGSSERRTVKATMDWAYRPVQVEFVGK